VLKLLLGLIDGLNPLLSVLFKLLDLVLKSLLVLLILLLMLTLDDFLGLLGNTIKLDVLGSLLKIGDLQVESLFDVFNSLKVSFKLTDSVHKSNLVFTLLLDASVFYLDNILRYEDSILVIGGDGKLRDLNPTLSDINDSLEVISNLLDSISGFLLSDDLTFIRFFDILILSL